MHWNAHADRMTHVGSCDAEDQPCTCPRASHSWISAGLDAASAVGERRRLGSIASTRRSPPWARGQVRHWGAPNFAALHGALSFMHHHMVLHTVTAVTHIHAYLARRCQMTKGGDCSADDTTDEHDSENLITDKQGGYDGRRRSRARACHSVARRPREITAAEWSHMSGSSGPRS